MGERELVVVQWNQAKFVGTARPEDAPRGSDCGFFFSGRDVVSGIEDLAVGCIISCRLEADPHHDFRQRAREIKVLGVQDFVVTAWNPEKGFGFATSANGSKDAYFRADAIVTDGIETLVPGSVIRAEVTPPRPGYQERQLRDVEIYAEPEPDFAEAMVETGAKAYGDNHVNE